MWVYFLSTGHIIVSLAFISVIDSTLHNRNQSDVASKVQSNATQSDHRDKRQETGFDISNSGMRWNLRRPERITHSSIYRFRSDRWPPVSNSFRNQPISRYEDGPEIYGTVDYQPQVPTYEDWRMELADATNPMEPFLNSFLDVVNGLYVMDATKILGELEKTTPLFFPILIPLATLLNEFRLHIEHLDQFRPYGDFLDACDAQLQRLEQRTEETKSVFFENFAFREFEQHFLQIWISAKGLRTLFSRYIKLGNKEDADLHLKTLCRTNTVQEGVLWIIGQLSQQMSSFFRESCVKNYEQIIRKFLHCALSTLLEAVFLETACHAVVDPILSPESLSFLTKQVESRREKITGLTMTLINIHTNSMIGSKFTRCIDSDIVNFGNANLQTDNAAFAMNLRKILESKYGKSWVVVAINTKEYTFKHTPTPGSRYFFYDKFWNNLFVLYQERPYEWTLERTRDTPKCFYKAFFKSYVWSSNQVYDMFAKCRNQRASQQLLTICFRDVIPSSKQGISTSGGNIAEIIGAGNTNEKYPSNIFTCASI